MGVCASNNAHQEFSASEEEKMLHKKAEKEIKENKAKMSKQSKVLLLGSGDSGKSTVLKQMRLIHGMPFTSSEIEHYRQLVFNNLTHGMAAILEALDHLELDLHAAAEKDAALIEDAPDVKDGQPFPPEFKDALARLWAERNVQVAVTRGNEFALPENLGYFFSHLDRVFAPGFVPTEVDIMQTRARTVGLTETVFNLNSRSLLFVDVGGQRSERRKWIHCFQDVTAIIFLVNLSGYDQCLVEDKDANQMMDAMSTWDHVTSSRFFSKTSFMLFLNKWDLFEDKIASVNIRNSFPDYDGPTQNALEGVKYFQARFVRLARKTGDPERGLYPHITTATDRKLLTAVMKIVEDIIIRMNLLDAQIL